MTITGAPSHQHSGPASPASHPEPSCSLLRQAAAPPGTFSPSPRKGSAAHLGPVAATELKAATRPCPSGSLPQQGWHLQRRQAPGRDRVRRPQSSPSPSLLLLLRTSVLPGPVQGAGGRKLRGRRTRTGRCKDLLPSAPLNQGLDTYRDSSSGRLPPPHPTHSWSSLHPTCPLCPTPLPPPTEQGEAEFLLQGRLHPL